MKSLSLFIICALFIVSCDKNHPSKDYKNDIKAKLAIIKSKPQMVSKEKKEILLPTINSTVYKASSSRDPFQPTILEKPSKQNTHHINFKHTPLQSVSLKQLTMVGTMHLKNNTWAIVALPNGSIYPVALGARIGKSKAKVIHISENAIKVLIQDDKEGMKEITLFLKK